MIFLPILLLIAVINATYLDNYFVTTAVSGFKAAKECRDNGGTLLNIQGPMKYREIVKFIRAFEIRRNADKQWFHINSWQGDNYGGDTCLAIKDGAIAVPRGGCLRKGLAICERKHKKKYSKKDDKVLDIITVDWNNDKYSMTEESESVSIEQKRDYRPRNRSSSVEKIRDYRMRDQLNFNEPSRMPWGLDFDNEREYYAPRGYRNQSPMDEERIFNDQRMFNDRMMPDSRYPSVQTRRNDSNYRSDRSY